MARMKRSPCAVDMGKSNVMSRSQAARRARSDHGYGAPSPQATTPRHASQTAGATATTRVPPVVPRCVGPPAKRRRCDTKSSQIADSDGASGDCFHTTISGQYNIPPDAGSLASVDGSIDPPPVAARNVEPTTNRRWHYSSRLLPR